MGGSGEIGGESMMIVEGGGCEVGIRVLTCQCGEQLILMRLVVGLQLMMMVLLLLLLLLLLIKFFNLELFFKVLRFSTLSLHELLDGSETTHVIIVVAIIIVIVIVVIIEIEILLVHHCHHC